MNQAQDGRLEVLAPPPAGPGEPTPPEHPEMLGAVQEYLAALEAGNKPNRQEFLARHPQIAEALAECLDGLEFVHSAASQLHRPLPEGPADGFPSHAFVPAGTPLGDFRIRAEIGRGGMGIVYEAEQLSLGRRVALKVLPLAAALDPRQLQRFQHEAQAAARLHHPHIVPVYAVGCERGVHYYAMQLVEGQPLSAVIAELRRQKRVEDRGSRTEDREPPGAPRNSLSPGPASSPPTPNIRPAQPTPLAFRSSILDPPPSFFQAVAQLGVQAAEALEHAHAQGVVHRDIKPANLLLDAAGELWVTDFGLARFPADAALTLSGDLVGTLRYMSPEQALARRGLVDQRADIYALGATLYELVTLAPVFDGQDRQELLRQITFEEPVPPRRLNRAVPVDLETIVLKALAKEPADRYATAQELAEDLRRFQERRPILARPPTRWQRAVKWARRHQGLVVSGVAGLVLAVIGLTIATWLIWREKSQKDAAYELLAREQAQKDEAFKAEARQRAEADAKRRFARRAVDDMFLEAEQWMTHVPQQKRLQTFLRKALTFYEAFARERGDDPAAQLQAAQAYNRVGVIQEKLGRYPEAEKAYDQSLRLLKALEPRLGDKADFQRALAACRWDLARLLRTTGRVAASEKILRAAVAHAEKVAKEFPRVPAYRFLLAGSHNNLANLLIQTPRLPEAERAYRRGVALLERLAAGAPDSFAYRRNLASARHNLAVLLGRTGRLERAERAHRRALAVWKKLASEFPDALEIRRGVAASYRELAQVLLRANQLAGAEKAQRRAVALWEKLAADFPSVPDYQAKLGKCHDDLGGVLKARGRLPDAEEEFRRARTLHQKAAEDAPGVVSYREMLAEDHLHLAGVRAATGRVMKAERDYRRAIALFDRLAEQFPDERAYAHSAAGCRTLLGNFLQGKGRDREAEPLFRQALAAQQKLAARAPDLPDYRNSLGNTLTQLAVLHLNRGEPAEAGRLTGEAIRHEEIARKLKPDNAAYRRLLGTLYGLRATILLGLGDHAEAARAAAGLGRTFPDRWEGYHQAAGHLVRCADLAARDGKLSVEERQARRKGYIRQAGEQLRRAVKCCRGDPQAENALAWFLATCPAAELRDAARACKLAESAVVKRLWDGACWNTLGVARYRAGDRKGAIKALKTSMGLRAGGDAYDWFVLAMAHWQSGNKDVARQWYDKAVAALSKAGPGAEELHRFRTEAAALMGIPRPPAPPK
jgi:serine/threonine protein kinase